MSGDRPVVLRVRGAHAGLQTADVFERYFMSMLERVSSVRTIALDDPALGDAIDDADFLCPDVTAIPWTALLLATRNADGSRGRLLFVAHAPGAYPLEVATVAPLLRSGDRIVAPSRSARGILTYMDPRLEPHVRVVPHPVPRLPAREPSRRTEVPGLLYMGRLHPDKLIHRLIDAVAVLNDRETACSLDIVGDAGPATVTYPLALRARIRRLGLGKLVRLLGPIDNDRERGTLLAGASALVNLSVTVEESFGKSVAEALRLGVPAVVTRWDGLPELLGEDGGRTVPVRERNDGTGMDVRPEAVAEAIADVLRNPSKSTGPTELGDVASVREVSARYAELLAGTEDDPPAVGGPVDREPGLLSRLLPLTRTTTDELLRTLAAARNGGDGAAGLHRMREALLLGSRMPIERLMADLPPDEVMVEQGGRLDGISGPVLLQSLLASLLHALDEGPAADVLATARRLERGGHRTPGTAYLVVEGRLRTADAAGALREWTERAKVAPPGPGGAVLLRQGVRVARRALAVSAGNSDRSRTTEGDARAVAAHLEAWLTHHPDEPESGSVWLSLAALRQALGDPTLDPAERALELLGRIPAVLRMLRTSEQPSRSP